MIQFKENAQTDRRMDRRTDGWTLFYRTLLATAGGSEKRMIMRMKISLGEPNVDNN